MFSAAIVSSSVFSEGGVDGIMGGELKSTRRGRVDGGTNPEA